MDAEFSWVSPRVVVVYHGYGGEAHVQSPNYSESAEEKGFEVEFKLVYQGLLPAESSKHSRTAEKHAIRKYFHKQLKELWEKHPLLSKMANANVSAPGAPPGTYIKALEARANKFSKCGFRFVPIVEKDLALNCSIDIVFLRRDNPVRLVKQGGDLDNRMNIVFDALAMPEHCEELPSNAKPDSDEDPFYVLVQDDYLITKINVSTDRLLTPPIVAQHAHNEVHLIVSAKVNVMAVSYYHGSNVMFLGE